MCQTPEFPSPMSPEIDLSVYENDNDQRWRKFVTFWIIFIIGCVSAIAGFYSLWPSNLVIEFTREFQILIVIILTSVIFLSVLWKICCKRVANYEDVVQPEINTSRRRTRSNLVLPADSTKEHQPYIRMFIFKLNALSKEMELSSGVNLFDILKMWPV